MSEEEQTNRQQSAAAAVHSPPITFLLVRAARYQTYFLLFTKVEGNAESRRTSEIKINPQNQVSSVHFDLSIGVCYSQNGP